MKIFSKQAFLRPMKTIWNFGSKPFQRSLSYIDAVVPQGRTHQVPVNKTISPHSELGNTPHEARGTDHAAGGSSSSPFDDGAANPLLAGLSTISSYSYSVMQPTTLAAANRTPSVLSADFLSLPNDNTAASLLFNSDPHEDSENPAHVDPSLPMEGQIIYRTSPKSIFRFNSSPSVPHLLAGVHQHFREPPAFGLRQSHVGEIHVLHDHRKPTLSLVYPKPITGDMFMAILQTYPYLLSLTVTINRPKTVSAPVEFEVKGLRRLTIKTSVDLSSLFEALRFPNLASFNLEWEGSQGRGLCSSSMSADIYDLLHRSSCYLTTLSLHNIFPVENHLIDCLTLPHIRESLQELSIWGRTTADASSPALNGRLITRDKLLLELDKGNLDSLADHHDLRHHITSTAANFALCPNLRHLELTIPPSSGLSLTSVVRWRSGSMPFSLVYSFTRPESEEDVTFQQATRDEFESFNSFTAARRSFTVIEL